MGYLVVPKLALADSPNQSVYGEKQLRLFMAGEQLLKRMGMLRSESLFQFANDGEVVMDWNVILPSETQISEDADNLARKVLALLS